SATARSMPMTRSSDVFRMPSLKPCTSTSPTRMLGSDISIPFPGERDHAARRDHHGDREECEWYDERAAGERQDVADHNRRKCAEHLRDEGAHALGFSHIRGANHAVHQHLGTGNADLLR